MIIGNKKQQGRRRDKPVNTDGVLSAAVIDFEFFGALQPLSDRAREALEPGFAERANYRLFSRERLEPLRDFVFCDGEWCEVFGRQDWTEAGILPHFEYTLLKPEPVP